MPGSRGWGRNEGKTDGRLDGTPDGVIIGGPCGAICGALICGALRDIRHVGAVSRHMGTFSDI